MTPTSPSRPTRRRAVAGLVAAAAIPSLAMTDAIADTQAPAELRALLPQTRLQGSGVLRFFGLRVYEARLWTAPGFEAEGYERHAFGLELIYDRKLEGAAIAERSVAEMRRVGSFDDASAKRWLDLMKRGFPDVVANDRLLGFNDGKGEVQFFHNGKPTVQTTDAEYAKLFFGIWLAKQSSAPALRDSLLGTKS